MKNMILIFLIALVLSCLSNGLTLESAPYSWPVGYSNATESSFGLKRDESYIPEINYTEGSRESRFMTTIDENSQERNVEFPIGANN